MRATGEMRVSGPSAYPTHAKQARIQRAARSNADCERLPDMRARFAVAQIAQDSDRGGRHRWQSSECRIRPCWGRSHSMD